MQTKEIILALRTRAGLSQEELAIRVFVTRQAVSRWETGDTTPNTETLLQLSQLFDVSVNTLLGSPRQLVCQCCGMPLEDPLLSKDPDGHFNEAYCKWCYRDGTFTYTRLEDLVDFCTRHMADDTHTPQQIRAYLQGYLPGLDYWKRYAALGGDAQLDAFVRRLTAQCNALHIEGMPPVEQLHPICGRAVNHPYRLPDGRSVTFLDDEALYLGTQLASLFDPQRLFGIVASLQFLLIYTCGPRGEAPDLLLYLQR